MAAVSSIRLLVVWRSPPPSSVTCPSGVTTIAPHPPGPGFPFAAPSANTTTDGSAMPLTLPTLRGGGTATGRITLRSVAPHDHPALPPRGPAAAGRRHAAS